MVTVSAKLKPLFVNISVLAVSSLLALILAEAILRISSGEIAKPEPMHQKLFVEYDPLLGWRKIPNATGVHWTDEYTVEESFNSKGLRGPEYSYEKANQEYRILVLGDSFAEGYTVPFQELFSEVLKRELRHPTKQIEVINAGTGGYSTDQEVLFFSHEGKKYTPDLTVLLFYQNDVWFNGVTKYWRGFKPRFDLAENGELSLSDVPVPLPESPKPEAKNKGAEDPSFRKLKHWIKGKSYLYRLVRDRVKNSPALNAITVKTGLAEEADVEEPFTKPGVPHEFGVLHTEGSQRFQELWQLTEALLLELRDDAASVGSRFVIFHVPFRASIYHDEWEGMERQYGMEGEKWKPEQAGIVLEEICERNGLDCLNPTEHFRKEAEKVSNEGERLYLVVDGHWNASGHRFAGERLADFISTHILAE